MSLRAFHIIFIIASVILCLYLGVWWMKTNVALGVVFMVCAGGLVVYGKRAFRKLRELP
ncbi:MAG TPA: hypothetical protein VNA04_01260 [Thermoanaerobaculia bacterium]|nr:hypothetical protein [Thermoanaerobaculia bacterium]